MLTSGDLQNTLIINVAIYIVVLALSHQIPQ